MNKDHPLVSIVTPSFNQAGFLKETIESVLNQDYPNIEYIVMDGGSTDNTTDILKSYEDRFYWVSEKDNGQSDAINKGWKMAKGSILAYLNSDDTYYANNTISLAVEFLTEHQETGIVFGDSMYTNRDGHEKGRYNTYEFDFKKVFSQCLNPIPQPSAFIRRDVLEKTGYLDENIKCSMDWDLWLRAGLYYQIDYLPHLMSTFRLHIDSKSLSSHAQIAGDTIYIYEKLFSNNALPDDLRDKEKLIMGRVYLKAAEHFFAGIEMGQARKFFLKALKRNSSSYAARHYVKLFLSLISPMGDRYIKKHYIKLDNYMDLPTMEV